MENAKHSISVLVELVLFPRIRAFNEDNNMKTEIKEKKKKEAIEVFARESVKNNPNLSEQEIMDIVYSVLDRTMKHTNGDYR